MKLIDLMVITKTKDAFRIYDKEFDLMLLFKSGENDINDYNQSIFESEVISIDITKNKGMAIRIDYIDGVTK